MTKTEKLTPPSASSEWSINEIQSALSRELPKSMLSSRRQNGIEIIYIPWYRVNSILNKYAPGWNWEITKMGQSDNRLFLVGRLTIPTTNGDVYREATGTEQLDCNSYGDPSSNAESMAFRRAAAKFGLGLYLYEKG